MRSLGMSLHSTIAAVAEHTPGLPTSGSRSPSLLDRGERQAIRVEAGIQHAARPDRDSAGLVPTWRFPRTIISSPVQWARSGCCSIRPARPRLDSPAAREREFGPGVTSGPPSTTHNCPVHIRLSSDASHSTIRATSAGTSFCFRHCMRIRFVFRLRRQPQRDLPLGHDPAGNDRVHPDPVAAQVARHALASAPPRRPSPWCRPACRPGVGVPS